MARYQIDIRADGHLLVSGTGGGDWRRTAEALYNRCPSLHARGTKRRYLAQMRIQGSAADSRVIHATFAWTAQYMGHALPDRYDRSVFLTVRYHGGAWPADAPTTVR